MAPAQLPAREPERGGGSTGPGDIPSGPPFEPASPPEPVHGVCGSRIHLRRRESVTPAHPLDLEAQVRERGAIGVHQ